MSESAVILEGEVARRFNPVDKLRVTNQDSSVSDWVPSDTLDLGSLMASENTLYLAYIDDDCDAYEEVEVDVSEELEDGDYKKITGKGNDGNDYAVGLDENGNLTSEMIPSAIHIVIKPRKLEYEEGETLDFTGIHVYLMDGNNKRFTSEDYPTGEIPFEELLLPVKIAEGEGSIERTADIGDKTGLHDHVINALPIIFCSAESVNTDGTYIGGGGGEGKSEYKDYPFVYIESHTSDIYAFVECYDDTNVLYFASKEPFTIRITTHNRWGVYSKLRTGSVESLNAKTFYLASEGTTASSTTRTYNIGSNIIPFNNSEDVAYVILYGENKGGGAGVPVQWIRSDGETLEDSFMISISASVGEINNGTTDSGSSHTSGGF